jgi:hypothetical protein
MRYSWTDNNPFRSDKGGIKEHILGRDQNYPGTQDEGALYRPAQLVEVVPETSEGNDVQRLTGAGNLQFSPKYGSLIPSHGVKPHRGGITRNRQRDSAKPGGNKSRDMKDDESFEGDRPTRATSQNRLGPEYD